MICAVEVMAGTADDSPSLRRLLPFLPQGTGDAVSADSAYASKPDCTAAAMSGRTPIMSPRSDACHQRVWGICRHACAFREEHPGAFCKKYAMRDGVEGAFSAIKARLGGFVRALNKPNRAVELLSMAICTA